MRTKMARQSPCIDAMTCTPPAFAAKISEFAPSTDGATSGHGLLLQPASAVCPVKVALPPPETR
jgi:hypothetical protein